MSAATVASAVVIRVTAAAGGGLGCLAAGFARGMMLVLQMLRAPECADRRPAVEGRRRFNSSLMMAEELTEKG